MATDTVDAATDRRVPVHPARVSRVLAAAGHDRSRRYMSGRIKGLELASEGFEAKGTYRGENGHWSTQQVARNRWKSRYYEDRILTGTTVRHVFRTLAVRAATTEETYRRLAAYAAALEAAGYAVEWRAERNDEPVLWVWQSSPAGEGA